MHTSKLFEFLSYEPQFEKNQFVFRYRLQIDNKETIFEEHLLFPDLSHAKEIPSDLLDSILHSLHLILGISYWKLYCPEEIIISTKSLSKEQADFWNTVYTKGLGEFFYRNNIDFRGLINFPSVDSPSFSPVSFPRINRSLVGIGGGKDSIVAAELLKEHKKDFTSLIIDTQRAKEISSQIAKIIGKETIHIQRIVDPQLFVLNKLPETFNGHIPISAIYAFIGILTGIISDYKYVIVSNEKSASYGNTEYLGETINHQWSKSLEFETMFQSYVRNFITPDVTYFSLLRPISELQITEVFSKYTQYFNYFSSCNRNYALQENQEKPVWCGECPKCAFVFIMLAAFLNKNELLQIFGQNVLAKESLNTVYRELLGVSGIKPFECVGTPEEVMLAFYMVYQKGEYNVDSNMKMFEKEVLSSIQDFDSLKKEVYTKGNDLIPEEFRNII